MIVCVPVIVVLINSRAAAAGGGDPCVSLDALLNKCTPSSRRHHAPPRATTHHHAPRVPVTVTTPCYNWRSLSVAILRTNCSLRDFYFFADRLNVGDKNIKFMLNLMCLTGGPVCLFKKMYLKKKNKT